LKKHYTVEDTIQLTTTFLVNGVHTPYSNSEEHWVIIDYDVGLLIGNGATLWKRDYLGNILSIAGTRAQPNITFDQLVPPTAPSTNITLEDGLIEASQNPTQLNQAVKILVRPGDAIAVSAGTLQASRIRVSCLLDASIWLR
jgi:hypothetical protein